jgi:hypothetical protein
MSNNHPHRRHLLGALAAIGASCCRAATASRANRAFVRSSMPQTASPTRCSVCSLGFIGSRRNTVRPTSRRRFAQWFNRPPGRGLPQSRRQTFCRLAPEGSRPRRARIVAVARGAARLAHARRSPGMIASRAGAASALRDRRTNRHENRCHRVARPGLAPDASHRMPNLAASLRTVPTTECPDESASVANAFPKPEPAPVISMLRLACVVIDFPVVARRLQPVADDDVRWTG